MSVLFLTPTVPVCRPHGSRLREALLVSAPSYIAPKHKLYYSAAEPILVGTLSNSAFSCGGLSACSPLPELLLSVFFVAVNVYQCGTHSQHKQTGMEIVSSRDFRSQMGEYLRKALSSEVVIKSRDFGSFKLVPLTEDDTLMSKEKFFAKIDRAIERVRAGQYTEVSTKEELTAFLDSL